MIIFKKKNLTINKTTFSVPNLERDVKTIFEYNPVYSDNPFEVCLNTNDIFIFKNNVEGLKIKILFLSLIILLL